MDNGNFAPTQAHTAWVRAYRADGWQVSFTFVLDADDPVGSANTQIAALAANGYTPNAPGLEAGERTEEITSVCRREFVGRDSKQKRVLDMWAENGQYLQYSHYMDSAADYEAFTLATGMDFDKLPLHKGVAAAARRDPNTEDMIVDLPRPVKVVYKVEGLTDKGKEKKEFIRWHGITPAAPAPQPANVVGAITPEPAPAKVTGFDDMFPPANGRGTPHWTAEKAAQDKFFGWANKTYALGVPAVLEALNVKTITQYTGSKENALKAIKAWIDAKQEAG